MKKNLLWSLATLLMTTVLSVGFASCSDDDDDDNPLVGTWQYSEDLSENYFTSISFQFKSNGTFVMIRETGTRSLKVKEGKMRYTGTYTVDGNQLRMDANQEYEMYDVKEGKWITIVSPDPSEPVITLFKRKGKELFFYDIADTEMTTPRVVYKKK